jgi:APA family basic amino acid/polyamine antiporter
MARLGDLPPALGAVSRTTATPLVATAIVAALVILLALLAPLERLAEATSIATLLVFALVNLSLLKLRRDGAARAPIQVPTIVPVLGLLSCVAMIAVAVS